MQYKPADFKILDSLEDITLENFNEKYDLIEGLIIALNMGKEGNIPLKNQIVLMKNRLVKELSKKMAGDHDYGEVVRAFLEGKDFEGAMAQFKTLVSSYFKESATVELEKKISHLINLCGDLRGKYNLN